MIVSLDSFLPPWAANAIALGTLGYGIARILQYVTTSGSHIGITGSPLKTLLPTLSDQAKARLPYPTDALPGARDVSSPYGSIRVYEWGPESGPKVLFVHGISTPCIALGDVAHGLVEKGCRVMLFDLFGRGFSDNPHDLPQDSRLFCSQILTCLASSSLSWTGSSSGRFALIGYSLGGGIAASFTAHFPGLVSSLILITPSGLLRPNRVSLRTKVLYSQGILPEPVLTFLVRRRLQGLFEPPQWSQSFNLESKSVEPVETEMPEHELNSADMLPKKHPELALADIIYFQIQYHQAFVQAYISSMRHGPIMKEHAIWNCIGKRLSTQKTPEEKTSPNNGLTHGKVLIICANQDTSIIGSDLVADATDVFEGNVQFRHLDAGHLVPISKSREVVAAIWEFWTGLAVLSPYEH